MSKIKGENNEKDKGKILVDFAEETDIKREGSCSLCSKRLKKREEILITYYHPECCTKHNERVGKDGYY